MTHKQPLHSSKHVIWIRSVDTSIENISKKCERNLKEKSSLKRVHFNLPPPTYADMVRSSNENSIGNQSKNNKSQST